MALTSGLALALASAALIGASGRPWATGWLALVGLVPLLAALVAEFWAYPALVAVSAIPFALAGAATVAVARRLGAGAAMVAFVPLVLVSEFVPAQRWLLGDYANVFTALGYTQYGTPLRAAAAWSGISAVSLLVLAANAAAYALVLRRRPLPSVAVAAGIAAVVLLGGPGRDVQATETAPLRVAAALAPAPLGLVGAVSYVSGRAYNAIFHWHAGALLEVFRKRALVPINERQYGRGEALPPLDVRGIPVGLGVCLDSLVPSFAREAVRAGAQLLVYVTEDSFAGQTVTPGLHLHGTAFRAIETGRTVVFANQSGPSAVIDPAGRAVQRLPHGVAGGFVVEVTGRTGITPFVRFGDWIGGLATVTSAVLLALVAIRPTG